MSELELARLRKQVAELTDEVSKLKAFIEQQKALIRLLAKVKGVEADT